MRHSNEKLIWGLPSPTRHQLQSPAANLFSMLAAASVGHHMPDSVLHRGRWEGYLMSGCKIKPWSKL